MTYLGYTVKIWQDLNGWHFQISEIDRDWHRFKWHWRTGTYLYRWRDTGDWGEKKRERIIQRAKTAIELYEEHLERQRRNAELIKETTEYL